MTAPVLRQGVRFVFDEARQQYAVLQPEGVQLLNEAAAAVLSYCDGQHDAAAITSALSLVYEGVSASDVAAALDSLTALGALDHRIFPEDARITAQDPRIFPEDAVIMARGKGAASGAGVGVAPAAAGARGAGGVGVGVVPAVAGARGAGGVRVAPVRAERAAAASGVRAEPAPYGLLAELTYRCPLRCPYCSNPIDLGGAELDTGSWQRVFSEARELGVLQLHLSGGEPLARKDLTELVRYARELSLYTNLITSGIGLNAERLSELKEAGLDHVQLSIQDADAESADAIAGIKAHERKLKVAPLITGAGFPLSINVVLHRHNVTRLAQIAKLAADLGAQRLELAHTQYYGWGLLNRAALLPTRDEVALADAAAADVIANNSGMEIVYVRPDYYDGVPKPCMNGWGTTQLVVTPTGDVLPCPAASVIPDLDPASVLDTSLQDIWYRSAAFNRFRGSDWMQEPCRSCPRKELDFGGCRCQAFQLTGDAAATDPACSLSPKHEHVTSIVSGRGQIAFTPRRVS